MKVRQGNYEVMISIEPRASRAQFFNVAAATAILAVVAATCSYAQSNRDQATAQPATEVAGRLPPGEEVWCGGEERVIDAFDQSSVPPCEIAGGLTACDELQQPAGSCAGNDSKKTTGQAGGNADRFRWGPALRQSLLFQFVEHGFRVATQPGTRAELKGPFFNDWFTSARNLRHWRDGDPFYVNYVGHPMQGAVSGFIQVQNDPRGIKLVPGLNRAYVHSRLRALGWSVLYSTQFELGPLSESSIGNVGLRPYETSKHPQAMVDMVISPVLGTAWLVGEDLIDHKLIRRIESRTNNRVIKIVARSLLNPSRSFANLMRGKWFWHRDNR